MIYDLQKASILKRISAGLLDFILTLIIATGAFFLLSSIFNYDGMFDDYELRYNVLTEEIKVEYGIDFIAISEMTEEEYNEFYKKLETENRIKDLEAAQECLSTDSELSSKFEKIFVFTIMIVTFGILIAYLIVEFVVPLFLKNGQTLGKKIFGICLMMDNGVRVRTLPLFVRTVLGKFTIETMIGVYCFIMLFLFRVVNGFSLILLLLVVAILISQIITMIVSKKNCLIHDLMAYTVVVDKESQMIFNTEEELMKYKQDLAEKNAKSKKTF